MKEWVDNKMTKDVLGPIEAGVASNRIRKNMDAEMNLGCGEKDKKRMKRNKEMNKNENEMKWIGNEIGNEGAQILSEAMKINTSLTSLDLRSDEKKRKRSNRNEKERNE